jgi:hypothetical protein
MAGTYYKYAEREADSYVNWAEIGKNMSDMLANENKVREEKKTAIDQASREFGEILANAPQGENRLMNEWALKFGGNAQSARLMQDKLLKSGQLKLNDYLVMRQNVTDGTTNAFNLVKDFQDDFKEMWQRMQDDVSSGSEQYFAKEVESFGDFNKTDLYINPTDGKVSIAYKDKEIIDGKEVYTMSKNPNKFSEINALRNRFKLRVDKYKLPTQMDAVVASFGAQITALQEVKAQMFVEGRIKETENILDKKGLPEDANGVVMKFKDAETKILQSQISNPFNAASVLDDWKNIAPNGKPYDYTWDPAEAAANPELILFKNEAGKPLPVLSAEQQKDALETLRLEARMRYVYKEEVKVTGQLERRDAPQRTPITSTEKDIKDENDLALNFSRQTSYLMSGTDEQKAAAVAYFRGKGADIDSRADGIYLANERGEMVVFKNKGNTTSVASSIVGPLLSATKTNLSDTKVTKYFPKFIGQTFNTTAAGKGTVEVETEDFSGEIKNYTDKNTRINIITDSPKETALKLGASYNKLGFKFEGKTTGMFNQNDFIKITAPNGTVSELIPVDNKDNVDIINQFIIDNRSDEKAKSVFKSSKAPR